MCYPPNNFAKYTVNKMPGVQTAYNNKINLDEIFFTAD